MAKKKAKKKKSIFKKINKLSVRNKRIIILMLISVFALIVLITTSFAMLVSNDSSDNKDLYQTGDLVVNINDNLSETINLNPAFPVSDEYGSNLKPYEFSITNNGDYISTYNIILTDEVISNSNGLSNLEVKSNIKYKIDNSEPLLLSTIGDNGLTSGCINPGETLTFNLRMWIDEEATSAIENTIYQVKVGVTSKAVNKCPNANQQN